MAKENELEGKIRDLYSQLKALRSDLTNENKTFKDFAATATEIESDRRKVQAQQEKMLNDLKANADKLQRSAISKINLNNLVAIYWAKAIFGKRLKISYSALSESHGQSFAIA